MFAVVHFLEENTVESVPKSWTYCQNNIEMCKWPTKSYSHFNTGKLIKRCDPPEEEWESFCCKIMKYSNNYEESCKYAKKAQVLSDLDTTDNNFNKVKKRKKSSTYRNISESDNGDEDLIIPPTPPRKSKTLKNSQSQNFSDIGMSEEVNSSTTADILKTLKGIENKIDSFETYVESKLESIENKMIISQKEIYNNIEHFKEDIKVFKKMLKKSDKDLLPSESLRDSALPSLPVNSVDDLIKLNGLIKTCRDESRLLTKTLAEVGGPKFSAVCHNIMKSLMTKEVAKCYSLKGMGSKLGFIDTAVYKCVMDAVKMTHHGQNSTDHDINQVLALHLISARPRSKSNKTNNDDHAVEDDGLA